MRPTEGREMNDEIKKYGDPNRKPEGIYRKRKLRPRPQLAPWGKPTK